MPVNWDDFEPAQAKPAAKAKASAVNWDDFVPAESPAAGPAIGPAADRFMAPRAVVQREASLAAPVDYGSIEGGGSAETVSPEEVRPPESAPSKPMTPPLLPGSVMHNFVPPEPTTTKIERVGAPITEETRQRLEYALSQMTPEQRDKANLRPDWVGSATRAIRRQQRTTDRMLNRKAETGAIPIAPPTTPELGEGRTAAEIDASHGSVINTPDRPSYIEQAGNDLSRGISQTKGLGYGLAAIGADAIGADGAGSALLGKYMQAMEEGGNPIVGTFRNARTVDDWVRYGIEAVFQNLPNMVPSLVAGGIGGKVARTAVERGVASFIEKKIAEGLTANEAKLAAGALINNAVMRGAGAGAYLASAGMEIGTIYGDTYKDTGVKAPGIAVAAGAVAGAFDAIPEMAVFRRVFGVSVADEFKRKFLERAKAVGIESLKQLPIEGLTEGIQTMIEQGATRLVDGKPYLTDELRDQVIDSILQGGIAGSVMGGVSEGVGQFTRRPPDTTMRTPPPAAGGTPPPTTPPPAPPAGPAATPPPELAPIPAREILGTPESGVGTPSVVPATQAPPEPVAPAVARPAQPPTPSPPPPGVPSAEVITSEADKVRAAGIELDDWLKQGDVLGRELHPETVDILSKLDEIGSDPALVQAFNAAFGDADEGQPTAQEVRAPAEHDAQPVQAGTETRPAAGPAEGPAGRAGEGQTLGESHAVATGQQSEGGVEQHPGDVAGREARGREDRELPSAQHAEGPSGSRSRGLPEGGPVQQVGGQHENVQSSGERNANPDHGVGAANRTAAAGAADATAGHAAEGDAARAAHAGDRGQGGAGGNVRVDENGRELHPVEIAGKQGETHTNPSPEQINAGNYQKAPVWVNGLKLRIENPQGSTRKSKPGAKTKWSRVMKHHYGYIVETSQGTPQKGRDKDHIDVFVGEGDKVFVVDQKNPDTGAFDEHKVMLNFGSLEEAKQAYLANYPKGWKGLLAITETTHSALKDWLHSGETSKRFAPQSVSIGLESEFARLHRALRTAVGEARMKPLYTRLRETAGPVENGKLTAAQLRQGIAVMKDFIREQGHGPGILQDALGAQPANEPRAAINEQLLLFNKGVAANRGINIEVAPNPDNKPLTAKFDALDEADKRSMTVAVGDEIIPKVLDDLKIDGTIEHTIGGFEGKTNPSIIVHFGDGVTFEQMAEAAKALGYVFNQKAVITYDESDTTNGTQIGFYLVNAGRPLSYAEQHDLFAEVVKHFPRAGGFTGHRGKMVFGNYTEFDEQGAPLTDAEYHKHLNDALGKVQSKVQSDLTFNTEYRSWRSEYDGSASLEGTRYGKGNHQPAGDNAGTVAPRGPWRLDALRAQASQAVARAIAGPIVQNRSAAQEVDTGISLTKAERGASIEGLLAGERVSPAAPKIGPVAAALAERARKSFGRELDFRDAKDRAILSRIIAHELVLAMGDKSNASTWYRENIGEMLAAISLIHPEITLDDDHHLIFLTALAITSNGSTVDVNFKNAIEAYETWKETGRFPTTFEKAGPRSDNISLGLTKANDQLAAGGVDQLRAVLMSPMTAGEVMGISNSSLKELVDEPVYGSWLFGPKIGSFLQNLMGNFDTLTIDRWFTRTWGRIVGRATPTEAVIAKARTNFEEAWRRARKRGEPTLAAAREITLRTGALPASQKSATDRYAKAYVKAADQAIDEPGNGARRRAMREVVRNAIDLVQKATGKVLDVAEAQALLWYPERTLYESYGANDRENTDYAKEAVRYVQAQGIEQKRIDQVLADERRRGRLHAKREDQHEVGGGDREALPFNRGAAQESGAVDDRRLHRQGQGGEAPLTSTPTFNERPVQPGAVTLVGVHYSGTSGLTELDGNQFDQRGKRSEESGFGLTGDLAKRVYFYVQEGDSLPQRERMIPASAVYRVRLTNLVDLASPTGKKIINEAATKASSTDAFGNPVYDRVEFFKAMERSVIAAGFDGYRALGSAVVIGVDKVPVESLGTEWQARQGLPRNVGAERIADMEAPEVRKYEEPLAPYERAAWALAQLGRNGDFFRFPVSDAKNLTKVAKDFGLDITIDRLPNPNRDVSEVFEVSLPAKDGHTPKFAVRRYKNGTVHVSLASLKSGKSGGALVYQMVAEWARNNKLRFEGDVDGLENIAHARRAEAMISTYLKSGSTQHMEPHQYQIEDGFMEDADALNVLDAIKRWRKLDDLTKLAYAVRYATNKIAAAAGDKVGDIRYDFAKGRFYDIWKPEVDLDAKYFADVFAKAPALARIGGGSSTLRRFAIVNTVLQAKTEADWAKLREAIGAEAKPAVRGLAYQQGAGSNKFPVADGKRVVARVIKNWSSPPAIVLHETVESARAAAVAAGYDTPRNEISERTKGFILDGAVHLVLPSFTSERDVLTTLAHEAVGHIGVEGLLGPKDFARLVADINALKAAGNKGILKLAASVRATHGGDLSPTLEAREIVARAAEFATDEHGNVRPGFAWFKRLIRRVAEWLRANGFNVRFTNAELGGILSMAARDIENGPRLRTLSAEVAQNKAYPIFYSALERAIEKAPFKSSAPASQWKSWLAANAAKLGVKKDEIEWSGINDWLDLAADAPDKRYRNVSREDVLSFLSQNGVQVSEVMLGERALPEGFSMKSTGDYGDEYTITGPGISAVGTSPMMAAIAAQEKLVRQGAQWQKNGDNDKAQRFFERAEALTRWIESYEGKGEATDTKFAGYTLPGGKNYRELLLTLPGAGSDYTAKLKALNDEWDTLNDRQGNSTSPNEIDAALKRMDEINDEIDALMRRHSGPSFQSSHFDQPNILAHIRFNERKDGDGKRVLFIEEIQSDWAQKGRKEGFRSAVDTYGWTAEPLTGPDDMAGWWRVKNSAGIVINNEVEASSERDAVDKAARRRADKAIPSAPFVGKTEAWVALALKRMIRYAVDNGFDRVAWTTGEQQAERYDLSQKVRSIVWSAEENGLRTIKINFVDQGRWVSFDVDRNGIASNADGETSILNGNNIESILGKDIAQRIAETDHGKLVGTDLKLGGEGMRAFYDKIVPQVANDVLKKLGGELAYGFPVKVAGEFKEQPSFDITPAMAEKVSQGQMLFNRGGATNGTLPKVGLLDAAFRFPGKYVAKYITQPLWSRIGSLADRVTPESWKHGMVSNYGLPEPYLVAKDERRARINQALRKTHNLINQIQALDRQQMRVAYQWMTESPDLDAESQIMATLPQDSRETLVEMKRTIVELGQEAVDLGLLPQEVYERNKLTYLHRSYQKYMREDYQRNSAMKRRAIAILGDQFKGRGMRDDVTVSDLQYESTPFAKGNKYLRLETRDAPPADAPPNAKGRLRRVIYWPAANPIPSMYQNMTVDGTWEARWVNGEQVGMWRDFTRDERQMMGEIDEVRFAFGHTMMKLARDIENARFLKWVAVNNSVATEGEVTAAGGTVVQGTDKLGSVQAFKPDDWVEVPNTTIPGTGVKKYGALAGRYVPGYVFNDIRQTANLKVGFGDTYQKMLRAWKVAKTSLSPVVHVNNVMSNFVLADWADVRARDIARAGLTIIAAKRGDEDAKRTIERFSDSGGDLGNFAHIELGEDIERILRKELDAELQVASDSVSGPLGLLRMSQILDLAFHGRVREAMAQAKMTKAWRATVWPLDRMKEIYGQEDTVFRLAKFMKEVGEGATDREAGKAAREAFIDYEINAPWVNAARRTALPFIAFSYRAIPLLAKMAADKPWKLAKMLTVFGGLGALTYAMLGLGGDDEDKERRLLPDELSGKILGVYPRMVRMPWNDKNGSPVFLDMRRWVPVGDVFETQPHSALPIPAWLSLGGPLMMAAETVFNTSSFTGKPIVKEGSTKLEAAAAYLDYQFKFWAPNLPIPNPLGKLGEMASAGIPVGWLQTYSMSNIMKSFKGETDDFGRERRPGYEALNSIGIKVRPYPPDQMLLNERRKVEHDLRSIGESEQKLRRQRQHEGLTQDEFDRAMAYQRDKREQRVQEFRKKAGLE